MHSLSTIYIGYTGVLNRLVYAVVLIIHDYRPVSIYSRCSKSFVFNLTLPILQVSNPDTSNNYVNKVFDYYVECRKDLRKL